MGKVLLGAVLFFGLFVGFLIVLSSGLDAQSKATMAQAHLEYTRGEIQANLIRAQSQAALNSAQASQAHALAFSITMMSLIPWGVLFTVSLLGLAIVGLVFVLGYFRHIERTTPYPQQIVYLPPPDLPRREVWNALSSGDYVLHQVPTPVNNRRSLTGRS